MPACVGRPGILWPLLVTFQWQKSFGSMSVSPIKTTRHEPSSQSPMSTVQVCSFCACTWMHTMCMCVQLTPGPLCSKGWVCKVGYDGTRGRVRSLMPFSWKQASGNLWSQQQNLCELFLSMCMFAYSNSCSCEFMFRINQNVVSPNEVTSEQCQMWVTKEVIELRKCKHKKNKIKTLCFRGEK